MEDSLTMTGVTILKGSCTRGHKWEYDATKTFSYIPTIQTGNGKAWCLLCIEEKMTELGVGEVATT